MDAPTSTTGGLHPILGRLPEAVRFALLVVAWVVAVSAALAPIVFLLRRIGVG